MEQKSVSEIIKEVLKTEGLEIAEETAILAAKAIFRALPLIVAATPNKIDDLLIPIAAVIEPTVLKLLDEINPADNK